MAEAKTSPRRIQTAERRNTALRLRKAGGTYREISAEMYRIYGKEGLPKGYDERYAYKDVMAILSKLADDIKENAEAVRSLELQRLDTMFVRQYERAVATADHQAVLACIRIMKRRADLLGLDAPKQTEVSGVDGGVIQVRYVDDWRNPDA